MVVTVLGGWCVVSVFGGIVLGHAMAGKSLRHRPTADGADAQIIVMPQHEPAMQAAL